jgi:hypothetical protein
VMVFNPLKSGPFWMTKAQEEKTHHDQILGKTTRRVFMTNEIVGVLNEQGVSANGTESCIQTRFTARKDKA